MLKIFASALLIVLAAAAMAEPPVQLDGLTQKQIAMLASEAQYFNALAKELKDEVDKLKADPCGGSKGENK